MAYAAVASLMRTIHGFLDYPSKSNIHLPKSERQYISDELLYLHSLLLKIGSFHSSNTLDSPSETRVKDAANKLEILLDSHLSDRSHHRSLCLLLRQHLPTLRHELGSFSTTFESHDIDEHKQQQTGPSASFGNKKMVGLNSQLKQLEDWLLLDTRVRDRHVIFVSGMTGIGKTALVQQVYNGPRVINKFDARLFLRIGPHYESSREMLLLAAHQLDFHSDKAEEDVSKQELIDYLSRYLFLSRYLIVLDNVWTDQVLKDVDDFPIGCKSRIIITTQILSIVPRDYTNVLELPLLNDDESWELLRDTVFKQEAFCDIDPKLEKIGRRIAKSCEGLPSAIIQVGELLHRTETTVEEWKIIAEKEDPFTITREDDTSLSEALFLSYRMLPQYSKVCFLYMGVFPKNYDITRSKLVRLLVSEGFIVIGSTSLEEIGGEYLDDLASRNIVLTTNLSSTGIRTTKTCKLHFTFRNLCVSEAKREDLFPVIKKYDDNLADDIDGQQRLCLHNNILFGFKQVHEWMESTALDVRSLLCFGPKQQYPIALYLRFRLLKVLDAVAIRFYEFPHQVLELFLLRYLAITYDGDNLPPSISCLWNLEVLTVHRHHIIKNPSNGPVYLPVEIWSLIKLRHLHCVGFDLPDPSRLHVSLVLKELLTLSGVSAHSCNRGVLQRMPSLTKVGIMIDSTQNDFSFLGNFTCIDDSYYDSLKSIKCVVINPNLTTTSSELLPSSIPLINFHKYIKKISLSGCGFPWEYMRVIGALRSLQVLKLRCYAFCGPMWSISTEYFLDLEYLLLEDLDIRYWEDAIGRFSRLRRVIVRHCYKLQGLPQTFDSIESLEMVEVDDCSQSAVLAVVGLKERRREKLKRDKLQVRIHSSWKDK